MCGRFTLSTPPKILAQHFDLEETPKLTPRYNIAPTQAAAVVRKLPGADKVELKQLRWGLVPAWAKELSIGNRLLNARSETAAEKPAFRSAFRQRRCLVPADGFYEWRRLNGKKQPYCIRLEDGGPFAIAGLWEHWQSPEGEHVETFTLLTTSANTLMKPIHERMPVILDQEQYDTWLDPEQKDAATLQKLLRPYPSEGLTAFAVSTLVNNPRNENKKCIEPLEEE